MQQRHQLCFIAQNKTVFYQKKKKCCLLKSQYAEVDLLDGVVLESTEVM